MTKFRSQFVVVEQPEIIDHQLAQEVALFYPDGSVYSVPEGEPGEWSPVPYSEIALSGSEVDDIVTQNENFYDLASLKMHYAITDTTDEWWKIINFDCALWFFDQEEGEIEIRINNIFQKLPELAVDYLVPAGVKAIFQGSIGNSETFGMLAVPDNPGSGRGKVLDMMGSPITTMLQTADNITFNGSWLIRNDD